MPRNAFAEVEAAGFSPDTALAVRQSTYLNVLAARWRAAFDAARSALGVVGPYLDREELTERTRRLAEERSEVARLLQRLARDLQQGSVAARGTPAIRPART
jgi:hypothetical protein